MSIHIAYATEGHRGKQKKENTPQNTPHWDLRVKELQIIIYSNKKSWFNSNLFCKTRKGVQGLKYIKI